MSHVWDYDVVASPKYSKETKDVDFDDYWVIKKWSDYGMAGWRPKEIKITLLCNGEAYDQVTLTKDMDWRYSWKNLRTDCEWLVVEDEVSGYTTKIRRNGVIFTVTNTTTNPAASTASAYRSALVAGICTYGFGPDYDTCRCYKT